MEKYVSVAEVREMLLEENETRGELPPIQKSTLSLAQSTAPISGESARAMREELMQFPFMSKGVACKISDLLPKYPKEVRAIFSKERVNLELEDIDKIIEIVGKYL